MNKKVLGLLIAIIAVVLVVGGIFLFGNKANEDEEVKDENVVNEVDDVEEEDEKTEYEKDLEEAIGDDKLSEEEMLKIGRDLFTEYREMYFVDTEEEFEEIVRKTNLNYDGLIDGLKDCCFRPGVYEDYNITFSDESVIQIGKDEFEYNFISEMTGRNVETNENTSLKNRVIAQITKTEEGNYIFRQMLIEDL